MIKEISPITRIEGHLKVEVETSQNVVKKAKIVGEMYRGIEKIVENRHFMDPIRIVQRVCGLCCEVHGLASCKAIENAINAPVEPNGDKIRDLIICLNIINDHSLHFYQLTLPDYIDFSVLENVPLFLKNPPKAPDLIRDKIVAKKFLKKYLDSFKLRTRVCQGIAILGAKTPFAHAILVGGVSTNIRTDDVGFFVSLLNDVKDFLEEYKKDILFLAENFKHLFDIGKGPGNYLSVPHLYVPGKVLINGKEEEFDVSYVTEDEPKYGFIKTPRYKGYVVETGPLAECILTKNKEFYDLLKKLNVPKEKANSLMGRLLARYVDSLMAYRYAKDLVDSILAKGNNIYWKDPKGLYEGEGYGFVKAPRGALIHYIKIQDSKVKKYSIISPSTWNFSAGGPVEIALKGCPVESEDLVNVGRIIRSFDPCTACSIQ